MIIVFEGIDRSGKTTQMSRLKEYLEATTDEERIVQFIPSSE